MAWSTAKLIEVFRLTVKDMPASVVSDAELESDIEIYGAYVSEKKFGRLYPKALAYFIAHMRTLNQMILDKADDGGAGNINLVAGGLTSEKEGDLARGYSASSSAKTSGDSEDVLRKTMYGLLFLQLRDMVIVPATIRTGGWARGACC